MAVESPIDALLTDDLLAQLHLAAVSITANTATGQLIARPRANLTPALSAAIVTHKAALLVLLSLEPMERDDALLRGLGRRAQNGDTVALEEFAACLEGYERKYGGQFACATR